MSDAMMVRMMEKDLTNKCRTFNIRIYIKDDLEHCCVSYRLVDTITSNQKIVTIYAKEVMGLDEIHKAKVIYDKIIYTANLLLRVRNN